MIFKYIEKTKIIRTNSFAIFECENGHRFESMVYKAGPRRRLCPDCGIPKTTATHGECHKSKEYSAWRQMRQRCNSVNHRSYSHYGGRGIKVCERWDDYKNFLDDMGRCPKGFSLDRIDVNGNYEPSNCRWAPWTVQNRNRRTSPLHEAFGEKKTIAEWAEIYGIQRHTVWNNLKKYPLEEILLRLGVKDAKQRLSERI